MGFLSSSKILFGTRLVNGARKLGKARLPRRGAPSHRTRTNVEMQNVVVPERLGKEHLRHASDILFPDEAQAGKGKLREQVTVLIINPADISFDREKLAGGKECVDAMGDSGKL